MWDSTLYTVVVCVRVNELDCFAVFPLVRGVSVLSVKN